MHSTIAAIALALFASSAHAELLIPDVQYPTLPARGDSQADFVPPGWKVEREAQGDLNRDGRADFMLVLLMQDPKNIVANPDGMGRDELDTNPRMLVIGLREPSQQFRLALADHTLIQRWTVPVQDDPFEGAELRNGSVKVSLVYWASAGSWSSSRSRYTFRFDQDCFRLIGYDYEEMRRNTGEVAETSINYLTAKVKRSTGTIEDEKRVHAWSPLRGERRICLESIGDGLEFDPGQ